MTQPAPAFQAITLAIADDIAQLTLNRPASLNALNAEMFQEIPQAIEQASLAGARALLITGAGRGFCSGADLVGRPFAPEVTEAQRIAINRLGFEKVITLVRALNEAPMPVVCAINGVAAGGGVGIALAGDVILMAASARFVLTFVPKLGLVPDVGATWLMSRLAGRARTLAASLLGDAISAQDAERWGLVARVIDDAALHAEAMAICRRLADGPQVAVVGTRRLVDAAPEMPIGAHILLERDLQSPLIGSAEHREGIAAFREKRPARFARG
ncbi:MAG: enoyl-CoA hydratase/isomerase family protein [Betaproteobacteria bacterium]|nr:enoyl-CoA hydratase/isomerase family protein [Betaproteobacteria bacterium]